VLISEDKILSQNLQESKKIFCSKFHQGIT